LRRNQKAWNFLNSGANKKGAVVLETVLRSSSYLDKLEL
jgi:hypothetical protein